MKAPFPYFGGKAQIASTVWNALGDVPNYIEPFFGSGAVLLARPSWHTGHIETVNDLDCYLANFWRALQAAPNEVAKFVDWPVNEADLEARHKWLVQVDRKQELEYQMKNDPEYYDARIAGWWCWGLCAWIGCGWCAGEYYNANDERNRGSGINVKIGKRPHLSGDQGVHRQIPYLRSAGQGVYRSERLCKADCAEHAEHLLRYMQQLADRLRRVRVCCGDWSRCCSSYTTTISNGVTGVFLDPPYGTAAGRDPSIYRTEDLAVASSVREWALERGTDARMRIALCGYEGEHDMPSEWTVYEWSTKGGFGNQTAAGNGQVNRHRERIWFSPGCLTHQPGLFDGAQRAQEGP